MKDRISELFKKLVSDRYFFMLIIIMLLQTLFLSILLGFSIRMNDRQLISNYSAFGGTHFYFGQWYYLFFFVVFGLIAALIHTAVAIKLYSIKGRSMAFVYIWFGMAVVFMGWVVASNILNLQALL
jgi:hypothetical protein